MARYTVETCSSGIFWYKEGTNIRHRLDGPATEYANGTKIWYLNGELHREDGPAAEYADGTKQWAVNGKRHREDGPAIEYADGTKEWWVDGERMTEAEFLKRTQKTCQGKVVEIDGVKYRLTTVE